jgi:hypothetical protein
MTLNPQMMSSRPAVIQWLIFAHECGHLMTRGNEAVADCWAIKRGRDQGWFTPSNFDDLMRELRQNPGSMSHPPGAVRIQHMANCFAAP